MGTYGDYVAVFLVAIGSTFALTFPVRSLAIRFGAVDQPGEHRMHARPTPVVGGAAMLVGFAVAVAVAYELGAFKGLFLSSEPLGVILGALVIYFVGFIDDVRNISAPAKVAGQVLAAMVLVALGVTMYYFKFPFIAGIIDLSPSVLPLVTALWVVGMANAVNLIDGLDGLATGIVAIASASLCVYGLQLQHLGDLSPDNIGPLVAAITCGVCVGFLPHNFHPARVFMGDGGALMLGLLMAAATMVIGGRTETVSGGSGADVAGLTFFRFAPLFIPFFILGVPILDTAFAIVRRAIHRSNVVERDLGHLHHRLVRLGHGHRRSVLLLWAWTAVLSSFALLPAFDAEANAFVPFGVVLLSIGLITLFWPGSRLAGLESELDYVAPLGPTDHPGASVPVLVSGAAGVAVAGEPDLASPARRRRVRPRHSRFSPRREDRDSRRSTIAKPASEVARLDDEMRG